MEWVSHTILTEIHVFTFYIICDALHDLVPFLQFKNCEQYPWRSFTFSFILTFTFINCTKSNINSWVFFTFMKLCKWLKNRRKASHKKQQPIFYTNLVGEIVVMAHATSNKPATSLTYFIQDYYYWFVSVWLITNST